MGEGTGTLIASAAFAAGALYLAYSLSEGVGKLKTAAVAPDEGPSTNVSHGGFIPYVVGRARVGSYYLWTGNRVTELFSRGSTSSSSTSATKGSKKSTSRSSLGNGTHYIEDAFVGICVGFAEELVDVFFAGKSILVGEESPAPTFTNVSHPSGTALPTVNSKGVLRVATIHWGELDQAADPVLTSGVIGSGVASRWPGVTYLQIRALLGELPRWPLMDIEIMVPIQDTGSVALASSTPEITSATYTDGRSGLNGAHILAQMLFGSYPYGLEIDPTLFDIPSLEALGVLLESESVLSSVVGSDGESFQALIAQLMQELSVMISWDQAIGKWRFVPIRTPSNVPIIPSDMVKSRPVEIQVRHTETEAEKAVFRYFDVARRFRPHTINVGSDSATIGAKVSRTRTIQLRTTIDHSSASKIAERRSQEVLGQDARYKLTLDRNAAALYPGRAFFVVGVPARLLVRTMKLDVLSGAVEILAMEDTIGVDLSTFNLFPFEGIPPLIKKVDSDDKKKILEVPLFMLGVSDPPAILVPRIRRNDQVTRADIHLSDDNVTYTLLGSTRTIQTGGVLAAGNPLPIGVPVLETGPEVTLLGPPDDNILEDLSGAREPEWRAGDQVVCMGEEIMFVREVVPVGGGRWRLDGVIRARMGTVQESHIVGADVLIFDPLDIFNGSDQILVSSNVVFVKTQPASLGGVVDLAAETPVSRTLYMTGHRPLSPTNLRVAGNINRWNTGDDVTLNWSYKSRGGGPLVHGGNGSGAGMVAGGQAVSDAPPEGDAFILRIYDDPLGANTLVHTETVTPGANGLQSFTFTNANLISFLGAEEIFGVELTERGNGLESSPVVLTIVEFI